MRDRPLVSFVLLAYNQERFIREAVEGAFAQTYSPLEIILSDDCSSDETFAIMKEMVAHYSGPHQVVLNQNATNRGLGAHVNIAFEIARGELIVAAAGDDVSLPERTERMAAFWEEKGHPRCSLYSNVEVINAEGVSEGVFFKEPPNPPTSSVERIEELIRSKSTAVSGCSHVLHRDVYRIFGPLNSDVIAEDSTLSLRALLLGGAYYLPETLVKYRHHSDNICGSREFLLSKAKLVFRRARLHRMLEKTCIQWARDLNHPIAFEKLGAHRQRRLMNECLRQAKISVVKSITSTPKITRDGWSVLLGCFFRRPLLPWMALSRIGKWIALIIYLRLPTGRK